MELDEPDPAVEELVRVDEAAELDRVEDELEAELERVEVVLGAVVRVVVVEVRVDVAVLRVVDEVRLPSEDVVVVVVRVVSPLGDMREVTVTDGVREVVELAVRVEELLDVLGETTVVRLEDELLGVVVDCVRVEVELELVVVVA